MLPGAIAGAVLIPAYHLFADLLGGSDLVRRMINSDAHFNQYRPEEKERLVEVFKSYGNTIAVSEKTKEGITSKVAEVNTLFSKYQENLAKALKDYPDITKPLAEAGKKNYEAAKTRLDEDVRVFTRLVNEMGTPPHRYGPEDIISRVYRMNQRVTDALTRQFELEITAATDAGASSEILETLKKTQEEQKAAILKPVNEAIDAMGKAAEARHDQEFMGMQQWQILNEVNKKRSTLNDESQPLAAVSTGPNGTTLKLEALDLENAPELLHKYNVQAGLNGDDQAAFTAKNGQRLKVVKNPDSSFSLEFDLPRRLFNPFYYCSPYSNIKSATQDAISIYIASGHIRKGGLLKLHVTFDDEKTATEAAREQYLAAIESGLKPGDPKQFYIEINGIKLDDEDVKKRCFTSKEDHARLDKCKGIAQRKSAKAEEKWEKTKQELSTYLSTPGKVEVGNWKESSARAEYKKIKAEMIPEARQAERKTEHGEWTKPPAAV